MRPILLAVLLCCCFLSSTAQDQVTVAQAQAASAVSTVTEQPQPDVNLEVQPLKGEVFRCRNPRVEVCAAKRLRILPAEKVLTKYPNSATWVYNNYSITDRASFSPNSKQPNKYYLSVLGMVKDDAGILSEWIEHHLAHGVEHIFVVDDKSTDGSVEILKPYVAKGQITIYEPPFSGLGYRQAAAYKNNLIKIMQDNLSKWVAFLDTDEFLYSPREVDLKKVLKDHEDLASIGLSWMWFGSNGLQANPASIVQSNTKRLDYKNNGSYNKISEAFKIMKHVSQKFIINTSFKVHNVDVHIVDMEGTEANLSDRMNGTSSELVLNHYGVQSKEHYEKLLAKNTEHHRHHDKVRPNRDFAVVDINDVDDNRLAIQNRVAMVRLKAKLEEPVV